MNFGEYLQKLLKEKNVSVAKLAVKMNIKSKNEIYRLFKNKYSYEKTKKLMEKIMSNVDFSKEEKHKLCRLMLTCKISYSERTANAILEKLYSKKAPEIDEKFQIFADFIEENSDMRITLYVGMIPENQSIVLGELFKAHPDIKIIQMVNFNTADEKIARQLFAIITFFQNKNHKLYENVGRADEAVLAIAEDGDICKLAVFDTGRIYISKISKDMAFYMHRRMEADFGTELKQNRVRIADYEYMLEYTCTCDENDTYSLHGMLCLAEIPYDIMYNLFKDANYFGFPYEHSYIQSLFALERKHDDLRHTADSSHYYFLSEDYVKKFLTTGITPGYIKEFRPLNPEEITETLKIFEPRENGIKYKGRFLREGYTSIDTECCYIDNVGIYISDSQSIPKPTYLQAIITHPKAMRVFKNFIKQFWESSVYSDEESRELLDKYIEEFKNTNGLKQK